MDELIDALKEASDLMYAGRDTEGRQLFLDNVQKLGGIPGIQEVIDPLFDAIERGDYLFLADIIRYDICLETP